MLRPDGSYESPSGIEVIPGFSLGSSKHIEHAVLFSVPPITVPMHLPVHQVLPLLVGGVYTIVQLVWVFDFAGRATASGAGGMTGAASGVVAAVVASSRVVAA